MAKVAGIALDEWKLSIFRKHLDAAGFTYEGPAPFTKGCVILRVRYDSISEIKSVVEAAQAECANQGMPH